MFRLINETNPNVSAIADSTSLLAVWQLIAAAVATPSAVVLGAAIWKVVTWWFGRKDTNKHTDQTSSMSYEQQLQAAFLASGARMDANTQWMIAHLKEFLDQSEREKTQIEVARNSEISEKIRYRELAQHWYWAWRESEHNAADAMQQGLSLAKILVDNGLLESDKVPRWSLPMKEKPPGMEDPMPRSTEEVAGPKPTPTLPT